MLVEQKLAEVKSNPQVNNVLKHKILGDYVLVLPMDFDTDDSIVNPRQYEDKPEWGVVIAVGTGRHTDTGQLIEPEVKEGDVVCFGQYASITVRSHGVDLFFVKQDEFMSKYEG